VTPERYPACHHVAASPEGDAAKVVDGTLETLGLKRTIMVVVPGYPDGMRPNGAAQPPEGARNAIHEVPITVR